MNCVFCNIIAGDIEAVRVHEDKQTLSFMDQRQGNPGHVLVVPKEHHPDIYSLPETTGAAVMRSVILMSRAVRSAFDCPGLNIWQSNGECAGQEVFHIHFHVHPRKPDDGLLKAYQRRPDTPPPETLREYADQIRAFLSS